MGPRTHRWGRYAASTAPDPRNSQFRAAPADDPLGRRHPDRPNPRDQPDGHAFARTRTENPLIKSQLLYQLSYEGEAADCIGEGGNCKRWRHAALAHDCLPWHCLNFLPDPQGQGSLRPTTAAAGPATCGAAGRGADGRSAVAGDRRGAGAGVAAVAAGAGFGGVGADGDGLVESPAAAGAASAFGAGGNCTAKRPLKITSVHLSRTDSCMRLN